VSDPTLFRLNHHRAATPNIIKAATTGPAMTPGLIDFPPELAGLGIHSICAQEVHDLSHQLAFVSLDGDKKAWGGREVGRTFQSRYIVHWQRNYKLVKPLRKKYNPVSFPTCIQVYASVVYGVPSCF